MQTIELGCEVQCVKARKTRCTVQICKTAYNIVDSAKFCFAGKGCDDATVDVSEMQNCVQPLVKRWNTEVKPQLEISERAFDVEARKRRSLSADVLDEIMEFESVVENLELAASRIVQVSQNQELALNDNGVNSATNSKYFTTFLAFAYVFMLI